MLRQSKVSEIVNKTRNAKTKKIGCPFSVEISAAPTSLNVIQVESHYQKFGITVRTPVIDTEIWKYIKFALLSNAGSGKIAHTLNKILDAKNPGGKRNNIKNKSILNLKKKIITINSTISRPNQTFDNMWFCTLENPNSLDSNTKRLI